MDKKWILHIRQLSLTLFFLIAVLFVCSHNTLVSQSCSAALKLWYNSLVPVVLPFLLLSGWFLSNLDISSVTSFKAVFITLLCGLLCGFPVGMIIINAFHKNNALSTRLACALMPLCNNVSPMFLAGYIYNNHIRGGIPFITMLACIYLPQVVYLAVFYCCYPLCCKSKKSAAKADLLFCATENASESFIENSISTIAVIGIYIVIFSVITDTIFFYTHSENLMVNILSGYLEITDGITIFDNLQLPSGYIHALILSLTSFGGLSAILQSVHIIKNSSLPLFPYLMGKIICGAATFLFVLLITVS